MATVRAETGSIVVTPVVTNRTTIVDETAAIALQISSIVADVSRVRADVAAIGSDVARIVTDVASCRRNGRLSRQRSGAGCDTNSHCGD